MKKIVLIFFFSIVISPFLDAQTFGVSAYALAFIPNYPEIVVRNSQGDERVVGHLFPVSPGIRVEGNYILPGFSFPVSAFNGLGFSYYFPHEDSAYYRPVLLSGTTLDVLATRKVSSRQFNFRFGYEIPQTFNDFLLLHFGWGMGYMNSTTQNIIPEKSPVFNYELSDFEETSFLPVRKGEFSIDILAGAVYEFEHLSVIGQYSVIAGINGASGARFRHGLTVGVFYPLKQL